MDYEYKMKQVNSLLAQSLGSNISQFMQNAYNVNEMIAKLPEMATFDAQKQQAVLIETANQYPFSPARNS